MIDNTGIYIYKLLEERKIRRIYFGLFKKIFFFTLLIYSFHTQILFLHCNAIGFIFYLSYDDGIM